MTALTGPYLSAARTALDLAGHAAVADHWAEPSALEGFTVGGLAAHLLGQVTSVTAALDADHAGKETVSLHEHYARAAWLAADIDNAYNTAIRAGGERSAEDGPEAVLADAGKALERLAGELPGLDAARVTGNVKWAYAMGLDDFLATRILELVVHADDLAYSTGVDTPVFDGEAFASAAALLAHLAAARHGQPALVRALARAERAPAVISGL
ncbi:maleylpyruvate isomerase N-terminal domain-containing protein [Glycomyces sp. MUSA5-2]|uniref:maleylpyruvate isomerase N-terminal domain-containing protein n=1 Tax=Glycomyces sp. MUSA5-2 TaxID=2053002 RepID=UPI003009490A